MSELPADPSLWTAHQLLDGYRAGRLSPREATAAVLARLKRLGPALNAFTVVDEEGAGAAAAASEARWQRRAPAGALDGLPITIKDLMATKGWPSWRGSKVTPRDGPWTDKSPIAAAIRASKAAIIGKTTVPEFGWKGLGDSPLTGITRNPWNRGHTPGGSSAGAAAAAAAGIAPLHAGSDGGGSVRIPASFSGVVGLKPSFGRVPIWPPSPFSSVSHAGPLTRSVADAALLLNVMSAPDPRDAQALPYDPRDWRGGLDDGVRGLKIAYSANLGYAAVDEDVARCCAEAVQLFAQAGAQVEAADPGFPNPREAFEVLWGAGATRMLAAYTAAQRALIDPGLLDLAAGGERLTAVDYVAADQERVALTTTMKLFHQRYDLLVTPTMPITALPVAQDKRPQDRNWMDWSPFSYPFNMSRQPAISMPCGVDRKGLPIGLQIVGPMFDDALVLRAARAFERLRPFRFPPALG